MERFAEEVRAAEIGEVENGHEEEWEVEGTDVRLAVESLGRSTA